MATKVKPSRLQVSGTPQAGCVPVYVNEDCFCWGAGGGGGGCSQWGCITGTLCDQTDLQGALDCKQDKACMVCNLTSPDDSHYPTAKAVADAMACAGVGDMLKSVYDPNNIQANVYDYCCFINTPTIPTDNCQLANGCGYTTCTGTLTSSNISNVAYGLQRSGVVTDAPSKKVMYDKLKTYDAIIPSAATCSNQLADKDYVNDSVNSVSAYYITKNAQGDQRATYAELAAATTFYSGGTVRVPTRNDYTVVLDDETHSHATTRYSYQGNGWEYQYTINETPMTQAQLDALNSGITAAKVSAYDAIPIITDNCQIANGCGYTTCTGTVSTCADVISALGYTPYSTGNPCNYINNFAGVISALGYTPYNTTNPCGFTTCTGTVTSSDLACYAQCCDVNGFVKENCVACINGCCLTQGGNICICGGGGGGDVNYVDVLVVGGGGGGGGAKGTKTGGGGGAGGVKECFGFPVSSGSVGVCVGKGGCKGQGRGGTGGNSTFDTIIAHGGGGGGSGVGVADMCGGDGANGGGGGGTGDTSCTCGGCAIYGTAEGFRGGCGVCKSGGNGGTSQCCVYGTSVTTHVCEIPYCSSISGTLGEYSGRGNGGIQGCMCNGAAPGGCGFGGNGAASGAGLSCPQYIGGVGGNGIVIVRYPKLGGYGFNNAEGGTKKLCDGYCIHTFNDEGCFVTNGLTPLMEYVVVAGGGGGGTYVGACTYAGGGGGGGEVCTGYIECPLPGMSYNICIGAGGCGGTVSDGCGGTGGETCLGSMITTGGKGGEHCGGYSGTGIAGGTFCNCCSSGGGGAGSTGAPISPTNCSAGGGGLGLCGYGGGGAGGSYSGGVVGGRDGGGNGGQGSGNAGCDATNCGGGGGGSGYACGAGGQGGGGIVEIKYKDGLFNATGGDCCYMCGPYKVHRFTSDGTFDISGSCRFLHYLLVGGGGGGGANQTGSGTCSGGGGGGGEVKIGNITEGLSVGCSLSVVVGAGGAGASAGIDSGYGCDGGNSCIGTAYACGGQGGQGQIGGASGGGCAGGANCSGAGGGGGGMYGCGCKATTSTTGGYGGYGYSCMAGGGGGGRCGTGGTGCGLCGGGGGGTSTNGCDATGYGGGGGGGGCRCKGGSGYQGLVEVCYPIGVMSATGGNTCFTRGNMCVHQFTSDGTLTITG